MFKKRKTVRKAASYALCQLEDQCSKLQAENDALRAALARAVDAGVGLENALAKSRAEASLLEEQRNEAWTTVQLYKEAWEALRWRTWVLLKSTNIDAADVFESDIRYRLDEEQSMDPAGIAPCD